MRTTQLGRLANLDLEKALQLSDAASAWERTGQQIRKLNITDRAGGIGTGDRQAIYYIISYLRPRTVLEIGTHIGASTIHIAAALRDIMISTLPWSITSVDTVDINNPVTKPWLQYGARYSVGDMIRLLQSKDRVSFVTSDSLSYLRSCKQQFDLIFLDGNHSAENVYQEICIGATRLNNGGLFLLHDYYPEAKAFYPKGIVVHGPFLAVQRLLNEGAKIIIQPFGKLPWTSEKPDQHSSLALIGSG